MENRRRRTVLGLLVILVLTSCQDDPRETAGTRSPWIVIGIDGGEWSVIHDLWSQGRLPHFQALAQRGVTAELKTAYTASPVIWTTIATGRLPEDHGITDFVVPTPSGDVPVSSTVRRVPALWNMLSYVRRRVAVLGWWATWPAEDVEGVVVSDRAWLDVERRVSPPDFLPRYLAAREAAAREASLFAGDSSYRSRDRTVARLGREMAREGYDLLLVYFRGVDIVSHNHWKYYRPEVFADDPPDAEKVSDFGDRIPREYEAVDEALGAIVAAAPDSNVMVVSDHGFRAAKKEIVKVLLDFDAVLERLGYLERRDGRVDLERSRLYTFATPDFRRRKKIRFGAVDGEEERRTLRGRLASDLARITYRGGEPVFRVTKARAAEARHQVDFVVRVAIRGATRELLLDGDPAPLAGVVSQVHRVSGTHGEKTHGIFLAAGPDVDAASASALDGIHIHDITPTLLFALGLPVAESFAGQARTALFTEQLRAAHPLRTISTWAIEREGQVTPSEADEELLRELGALGYLD